MTEQVFFNESAIQMVRRKVSDTFSEREFVFACVSAAHIKRFISLPKCLPRQETIEKQPCNFLVFKERKEALEKA